MWRIRQRTRDSPEGPGRRVGRFGRLRGRFRLRRGGAWGVAHRVRGAPFGFDLSAVERAVVECVDGAREGVARVRPVEWPVPEAYLWFILRDR